MILLKMFRSPRNATELYTCNLNQRIGRGDFVTVELKSVQDSKEVGNIFNDAAE